MLLSLKPGEPIVSWQMIGELVVPGLSQGFAVRASGFSLPTREFYFFLNSIY